MEAIGAASAIIGVAQFGLQFSQVLVTVIGDYKDAARNINRLRDEIHLAAICLKQLGDLANQNLLRQYGILEATNLRERCQAVFWEIRGAIKKGDTPLHPTEITKDQIDVSNFTSFRWALWTKNKLQEPRQELDRLKDSMTLCFVSHMAILATTDLERASYASQIPGIKRSLAWSEKHPDQDYFRARLEAAGISADKIDMILGDEDISLPPAERDPSQGEYPNKPERPPNVPNLQVLEEPSGGPILRAWSIDPLARTSQIPVSQKWLERYVGQMDEGDKKVLKALSKLHPWFKDELDKILQAQSSNDQAYLWSLVHIKPQSRHLLPRKTPRSVQVVLKGSPRSQIVAQVQPTPTRAHGIAYKIAHRIGEPLVDEEPTNELATSDSQPSAYQYAAPVPEPVTYEEVIAAEPEEGGLENETDEDIIAKQLALYQ